MDAFFVSVELLRHPELVGQPVVVGGTANRGVVAAASYEARRFGVHSALPSAVARRRCPHAVFLPGDHAHYSEVSARVHEIFARFTPMVEPLSLDEAFLDVTGARNLFGSGTEIAWQIREAIRNELDLGCCIGVAPNKFLAKLASVEAKPLVRPDRIEPGLGVKVVDADKIQDFLDPLAVQKLWGVGPVTLEKLQRLGIRRVADLRVVDLAGLNAALGPNQAAHLAALAVGDDDRPVEADRGAKSISHEETFATDVRSRHEIRTKVIRLADAVATRLRSAGVGAKTLTLKVRFSAGFQTLTRSVTLDEPVAEASAIVAALDEALDSIDPTPGVRLIGVASSNFGQPFRQLCLDLVDEHQDDHSGSIETGETLDMIRNRFGADAIGPASSLQGGKVRTVRRGGQQWGPDAPGAVGK